MNPIQQVPFNENGRYDFRLPAGFNTQRYSYPYQIDMIGFGSSDTSTNRIPVKVNVYKEAADRTYRAVIARTLRRTLVCACSFWKLAAVWPPRNH